MASRQGRIPQGLRQQYARGVVLATNTRARRFVEQCGAVLVEERPTGSIVEVVYRTRVVKRVVPDAAGWCVPRHAARRAAVP